ncbi:MAG: tyrosine-protein phosphatase [Candidatus Dormibacteraeota bacterium]|nr:tyrosine-protein phosphatase [Candidatus Dormibacteraeota bacterium]
MRVRADDRLTNGRDLGGLATTDGGMVRPGVLFRSDDTGWAQGARSAALPDRVATAFDLRRPEEVAARGLPWFVDESTRRISKNLAPVGTVAATISDATQLAEFYIRLFEAQTENLGEIVAELASTDRLPAAVYCVAGKDRTGVVVATLGRLLGVRDEALVADYARSASFMEGVRESGQLGDLGRGSVVLPLHDAPEQAMRLFLEAVASVYPSQRDLIRGLGLDSSTVAHLRERYLVPAAP